MATGTSVARWVTLAAAVADTTASRYPICWANHRLDAPACSASRQTSSISAVDEKPSKNTPTAINHSLHWVATRTVAAESADIVTGPVGVRHAALDATRLQRTVHGPLFTKCLLATATDIRQRHGQQQRGSEQQESEADRSPKENGPIAVGQDHGAAKIFLKHGAEHESEQQRGRLAVELAEAITDYAEYRHDDDVGGARTDRVCPDAAQDHDGREQIAVGHPQQAYPDSDQWQIEDHQHQVS